MSSVKRRYVEYFITLRLSFLNTRQSSLRTHACRPGRTPKGDKRIQEFEQQIVCWLSNYGTSLPEHLQAQQCQIEERINNKAEGTAQVRMYDMLRANSAANRISALPYSQQ
jgi:hypothetical protein